MELNAAKNHLDKFFAVYGSTERSQLMRSLNWLLLLTHIRQDFASKRLLALLPHLEIDRWSSTPAERIVMHAVSYIASRPAKSWMCAEKTLSRRLLPPFENVPGLFFVWMLHGSTGGCPSGRPSVS